MKFARHAPLTLMATAFMVASFACKRSTLSSDEEGTVVGASEGTKTTSAATSNSGEVTFTNDILPILESKKSGENYGCTTCHRNYVDYSRVANVGEVERMIQEMESGRMPIKGDHVRPEHIEKFRKWRLTGFKR